MNNGKAEWWSLEAGGFLCSNCGYFIDDLLDDCYDHKCRLPFRCGSCGFETTENPDIEIDNKLRIWDGLNLVSEDKYPEWFLKRRKI